jgi:hypothetical protein
MSQGEDIVGRIAMFINPHERAKLVHLIDEAIDEALREERRLIYAVLESFKDVD